MCHITCPRAGQGRAGQGRAAARTRPSPRLLDVPHARGRVGVVVHISSAVRSHCPAVYVGHCVRLGAELCPYHPAAQSRAGVNLHVVSMRGKVGGHVSRPCVVDASTGHVME